MRLWRQAGGAAGNPSSQRPGPASGPDPVLTAEGYSGLEALLNEHAEEVLGDVTAKDPASAKVTEYLFRAITEVDAEGRGIRRPRRLSALLGVTGGNRAVLEQVVERFAQPDCGFLVRSPGRRSDDRPRPRGAHPLLEAARRPDDRRDDAAPAGWLQRERRTLRIWRSLVVQAEAGDRVSPAVLKDREAWSGLARPRIGPSGTRAGGTGSTSF